MTPLSARRLAGRMRRLAAAPTASLWRRLPAGAKIAAFVVAGLVLLAVVGPAVAPYPATRNLTGPLAAPPDAAHWFGTDVYGRDVLSRIIHGTRVSVVAGLVTPLLALAAGTVVGAAAALAPGPLRRVLEWLLDLLVTFPGIVLAVALAALLSPGLPTTVVVLSVLFAPAVARVVRAAVVAEHGKDYVLVGRFMGAGPAWLLAHHVARNVAGPVLVFTSSLAGTAVLTEASLSFLGLSVQPPTPSWGNVVNDGRDLMASGGWWVTTFAGLATLVAVLALSVLADGLAAALGTAAPGETARAGGAVAAGPGGAPARSRRPSTPESPGPAAPAGPRATVPARRGEPLLAVRDLGIRFPAAHGGAEILSGVSFDVHPGESVGLVGESGSGKSLTTLAVMGLLPPGARVTGSIRFAGRELTTMPARERRKLLGTGLAMVYQDALSALNPGMRVGTQLRQVCRHSGRHRPADLLRRVHLDPDRTLSAYPHQLSGGQRQRVLIAMALAGDPALLLADEPTTALDVTLQAEIAGLLRELTAGRGLSMLLVSHDLAFVAQLTSRINVMYAGEIVEAGPVAPVLAGPRHRYLGALTTAITSLERGVRADRPLTGAVPQPGRWPAGCRFSGRCPYATARCRDTAPVWAGDGERGFACHHPAGLPVGPEPVALTGGGEVR
ncbi:dipeptide/oligopeptide/nickel ABC transporter permease/ATP-binding protein [Polymorphospora rubra]|uniref:dipeptide/oligopeptide/nickel ABC transporter permease/ATP-binding protein n=1 Tax=Polymorphospora rubra TaxID=338584 RepID=UPI0033FC8FA8